MKNPCTNNSNKKSENQYCEMNIHIDNQATINIFNCSSGLLEAPLRKEPQLTPFFPLRGPCIPESLRHKPKKSLKEKLQPFLKNKKIPPSTLAAGVFQTVRRFHAGELPASDFEKESFHRLEKLSPGAKELLACSIRRLNELPSTVTNKLFNSKILKPDLQPFSLEDLREEFVDEILKRTSTNAYGDESCIESEHPGLARRVEAFDLVELFTPVINCISVQGFPSYRTNTHRPALSLGEYTRDEFQQICTPEIHNGEPRQNCRVMTENCPGNQFEGHCLRVPEVRPGDLITLEGFNFFNIDGYVILTGRPPSEVERTVEIHVCGDTQTPLSEEIDGRMRIVIDNRVRDILTFRVPEDLPEGIYGFVVVMPNNTGRSPDTENFRSDGEQYFQVLASEDTIYQIATERLYVREETGADWSGSDDLGLIITSIPIYTNDGVGEPMITKIRKDNLDTGEERSMENVIFRGNRIAAVSIAIVGFEIDDDDLYEEMITEYVEALEYMINLEYAWIAGIGAAAGAGGATWLLGLAAAGSAPWVAIAAAIAAAITLGITMLYAIWARPDLIIQDAIGLSAMDLSTRTSVNFPPPPLMSYVTDGDIEVKTELESKDLDYKEWRKYNADDGGSRYHILFRYSREV
jgi:hypothetical protein